MIGRIYELIASVFRPIMAIVFACLILLFVSQYTQFTNRIRPQPLQISERQASGTFDVRIVTTFDAQGNEFGSPALLVKFRDRVLVERTDSVMAGEVIEIENVLDVAAGENQFFVQVTPSESGLRTSDSAFSLDASPAADDQPGAAIARAVRVEIRRSGNVIAENYLWSSASGPFGEFVRIDLADSNGEGHNH